MECVVTENKLNRENLRKAKDYFQQAKSLTKQNKYRQAIAFYEKAIKYSPDYYQAYIQLGNLLRKTNDLNTAIDCYLKAAQIRPNSTKSYGRISHLLKRNHLEPQILEKIEKTLQDILVKDSNILLPKITFANTLTYLGKIDEAIEHYQKLTHEVNLNAKPQFVNHYWDSARRKGPNFLIIGFAKCGTTALYNKYLNSHPQILPTLEKEIKFFNDDRLYQLGLDWYLSHFPPVPDEQLGHYLTGEASADYITNLETPQRLHNYFPDVKLIVLLRNPVLRLLSLYSFQSRRGGQFDSLEKLVNSQIEKIESLSNLSKEIHKFSGGLIAAGLYVYYLEKWFRIFPRDQFLILRQEDLAQDTENTMKKVFKFLDLPHYDNPEYSADKKIRQHDIPDEGLLRKLADFYTPHNKKLEELLGIRLNRSR